MRHRGWVRVDVLENFLCVNPRLASRGARWQLHFCGTVAIGVRFIPFTVHRSLLFLSAERVQYRFVHLQLLAAGVGKSLVSKGVIPECVSISATCIRPLVLSGDVILNRSSGEEGADFHENG